MKELLSQAVVLQGARVEGAWVRPGARWLGCLFPLLSWAALASGGCDCQALGGSSPWERPVLRDKK